MIGAISVGCPSFFRSHLGAEIHKLAIGIVALPRVIPAVVPFPSATLILRRDAKHINSMLVHLAVCQIQGFSSLTTLKAKDCFAILNFAGRENVMGLFALIFT